MKRTELTITEFAKSCGVTRDTIYKWLAAGKSLPKGARLKKVAGRNYISIPDKMISKENI